MNEETFDQAPTETMLPAEYRQPETITPAQAKVDAIAHLTMSAYQKASTLVLTPEEVAALIADFPDAAFRTGADGKENLIFIEHAHLRDRLNSVFGPGQWAIIPRNRWAEDYEFTNSKNQTVQASRVYVEAMLCVRGCFVAEAVGDMVYYKNNANQNYGDAVEGAKTAALRRCAKELGIGLQAWKKDWCDGWWKRRQEASRSKAATAATPAKSATEKTRAWFMGQLGAKFDLPTIEGWAMVREGRLIETWPLEKIPTSKAALNVLMEDCHKFATTTQKHRKPAKSSPQTELATKITAAGFTWEHFRAWAVGTGNLDEDDPSADFGDLHPKKALQWLTNLKPIIKGLQAVPASEPSEDSEPPHHAPNDTLPSHATE